MEILLLEDDELLNESLAEYLSQNGYNVTIAYSIEEASEITFHKKFDLYLIDINLPDGSGIEFAKMLQNAGDTTPVIFITALTDIDTISKAFATGASDYIKKPFFPKELLLRIEQKFKKPSLIQYKNILIDLENELVKKDGSVLDITPTQFKIIKELFLNINQAVTKERLLELMDTPSENGLRVLLNKIKKTLLCYCLIDI